MHAHGIGIDVVEIKRFARFRKGKMETFLQKNFTEHELAYCFSFKDAASHLAGTFAAKEAAFKALGKSDILLSFVEIRRKKSGVPEVWLRGRRQKSTLVSISHDGGLAVAIAIHQ